MIVFCFVVAIFDLVHDAESIFFLPWLLAIAVSRASLIYTLTRYENATVELMASFCEIHMTTKYI